MKNIDVKVSVIVTAHNYGKYLSQCLDSVLEQNYDSYEIIVVNDGSSDNTEEILENYKKMYPDKITISNLSGVGLAKAANIGISKSSGEYIIRLDADDYFDENILLVESNILDRNNNVHMVYPDYFRITKHGEIIDNYILMKVNDEVKLLDRSPLAAGSMFRRTCFDSIGGYNEELRFQEDYDFWIRFIDKYNVYNVNLPLMYYRQHDNNMSKNFASRMDSRRYVKRQFVSQKRNNENKKIMAVIPAMGLFRNIGKYAVKELNGKPLIAYTIEEALKCKYLDRIIVSTEDEQIADISKHHGAEIPFLRSLALAKTTVPVDDVLRDLLFRLKKTENYRPDIVVVLPYFTPFRKHAHITEAIDTLLLYDTDSVISVTNDITFHWKPGKYGLKPIDYQKRFLREDRETIYKENGSIYAVKSGNLTSGNYLGKVIGHIEFSQIESYRVENEADFWMAEKIIEGNVFNYK